MKFVTPLLLFVATASLLTLGSCRKKGCTDPLANNYNPDATAYDGSCTYDPIDTNVRLTFHAKIGNEDFAVNSIATDAMGNQIRVETFKFYVSDVRLVMEDDTEHAIKDIAVIDFHPETNNVTIESRAPRGDYKAVKFFFGLPEDANDLNPNDFQSSHPLSFAQGMHWDWTLKYLFIKFDGLSDTTGTGNQFDHSFVYHCGSNSYYEEVETVAASFTLDNTSVVNYDINIDVDKFFANGDLPIDLKTDYSTHTADNEPLAKQFTHNVVRAFSE